MKNNLPPFIEIYRALIATPSISATEELSIKAMSL